MAGEAQPPIARSAGDRDLDLRARRAAYKKGLKAIEVLRDVFFDLAADEGQHAQLDYLAEVLTDLQPPEPRKCKEYRRAMARQRKGLIGIPPEDVALYCRCLECTFLRDRHGLAQPGEGADDPDRPPPILDRDPRDDAHVD